MAWVGNMAWRIGEISDLNGQLDWTYEHGLKAVSFHGCAGYPPAWEGAPLLDMDGAALDALKRSLSRFARVEVHMPFKAILDPGGDGGVDEIVRIAERAEYVGACVATIHSKQARPEQPEYDVWRRQIEALSKASKGGIKLCLELTAGFEVLYTVDAPNVGFTLDVGHMVQPMDLWSDGVKQVPIARYPSWRALTESIWDKLWHTHIHDYDGTLDHIPLGRGGIGYGEVFGALKAAGFDGTYCLELNPDRMVPDDIVRSAERIRAETGAV